jgi:excinuclease ABC subunit B
VLVTTLTKRMAEDLTEYYADLGVRVRYLHADIETLEREELLRGLRRGEFDVLVGINLLREGLDLPEVSLVAIFDADKEGFLRSGTSLIQTCGRAARNVSGKVIMYADRITVSMQAAIDETHRRRVVQEQFNQAHGIVPRTTRRGLSPLENEKAVGEARGGRTRKRQADLAPVGVITTIDDELLPQELPARIAELRSEMQALAKDLRYEDAARVRDQIRVLEARLLEYQ